MFPYLRISHVDGEMVAEGTQRAEFGTKVDCGSRYGGIFSQWTWDGSNLTAETDPFGMSTLFYAVTDDGIAISTSPVQLIASGVPASLDHGALAVFHLLGCFIGDDTPFRAIRALEGTLRWSPASGLSITKQDIGRRTDIRSVEQAVTEYERLFATAVERCGRALSHKLVIPLSGGRDSRHMLLEALRQGLPVDHCLTFDSSMGEETDPDAHGARLVTDRLHVRHKMIHGVKSRYRDQIITHGMAHLCTDEHVQCLAAYRYFQKEDCAIFDGIAGDSLSRNKSFTRPQMVEHIKAGRVREAVDLLIDGNVRITGLGKDDLAELFPSFHDHLDEAKERIAVRLEMRRDAPDPYAHFIFGERTRREISLAPNAMLSSARQVFAPYLDPDLAELCLSLPYEVTGDGRFHDRVIAHSFPDIDLPYSEALKGAWPRPTLSRRAGRAFEAIAASRLWAVSAMPREAARQIQLLTRPSRASLYRWQTYHETLDAVGDRASAASYLRKPDLIGNLSLPDKVDRAEGSCSPQSAHHANAMADRAGSVCVGQRFSGPGPTG